MGNIPLVTSERSPVIGVPTPQASPDAFGAGVGRAIQGLGGQIAQSGEQFAAIEREKVTKEKNRRQDAQLADAVSQSDFTPEILKARQSAPPDGSGVYNITSEAYDKFVQDKANAIPDPEVRAEYLNMMKKRKPEVLSGQAQFEYTQGSNYAKDQADISLTTNVNKVRGDPNMWQLASEDSAKVIQARPDLSQSMKDSMIRTASEKLANARFQGMLASANSIAAFDAVEAELTAKDSPWQARMSDSDYEQTLDQVRSARNAFGTAADATARTLIQDFKTRSDKNSLIDPTEMAAGQKVVEGSKNSLLQAQFARIARDQDIIRRDLNQPPETIRRNIAASQNGSVAGLPPEVTKAANSAAGRFNGVSSSYLGGTIKREYGGNFAKLNTTTGKFLTERAKTGTVLDVDGLDANFADRAARAVAAAEAATGQKAVITDAGRPPERSAQYYANHTKQPYVYNGKTYYPDPSAQGGLAAPPFDPKTGKGSRHNIGQAMDIREGAVNDWLHLHGSDFGLEFLTGRSGALDPVHMQLAASAGGGIDHRGAGGVPAGATDYSKGTATSNAVGAFQFLPKTWLDLMKDGKTPQRFGLDITGKTDAELLELRKDLDVSTNMAAAYAEQNVPILAAVLGRAPTDSELYMAHFLGPTGASNILQRWKTDPKAIAADLAPAAAEANHNVFYDKQGNALTVDQVYHNIGASFEAAPDQMAYGDQQVHERVADANEAGIKKDFVEFNRERGQFGMGDLNTPNGFEVRSQAIRTAADYYTIAIPDVKPFSVAEADGINKAYKEGTTETQVQVLGQIQSMGTEMARAAYKQLGTTNPTMEYAGALKANGQDAAALDVLEGTKAMEPGKESSRVKAATTDKNRTDINANLNTLLGASMSQMTREFQAGLEAAAIAHYVNTYVIGKGGVDFNPEAFKASVNAVMGGTNTTPAAAKVNGATTILPKGVTAGQFELALDNLTPTDMVEMSSNKHPPMHGAPGKQLVPVTPEEMAAEGQFKAIGGDMYKVQFADGGYAISGYRADGAAIAYVFVATPENIAKLASRIAPTSPDSYQLRPGSGQAPTPQASDLNVETTPTSTIPRPAGATLPPEPQPPNAMPRRATPGISGGNK